MRDVRVASVQFESAAGDKQANFEKVERFAREAAGKGAAMVVFPECCLTGYWFMRHLTVPQLAQLAESVPEGPSCARLRAIAVRQRISVGAGLLESTSVGVFHNTYVVAMPDGTVVRHRKLHAFEHPAIHPGAEYTVFDTPHGFRAGLLICYDVNIVENVRIAALRGAEVLLAPHQTGGCRTRNPHLMGVIDRSLWENRRDDPGAIEQELRGDKGRGWLMRWLPSRAHDNGLFLVFSNGVGIDDDEVRTGNAMILDPVRPDPGRDLGKPATTWWSRTSTPRCWNRPPAGSGCAPGDPISTASWPVATGLERDTHQLKFEE